MQLRFDLYGPPPAPACLVALEERAPGALAWFLARARETAPSGRVSAKRLAEEYRASYRPRATGQAVGLDNTHVSAIARWLLAQDETLPIEVRGAR